MEIRAPISPGIITDVHARRIYGAPPIAEETANVEELRTSITGADDWWKAIGALSEFYTETARAYGLLGPPRPRRDEQAR